MFQSPQPLSFLFQLAGFLNELFDFLFHFLFDDPLLPFLFFPPHFHLFHHHQIIPFFLTLNPILLNNQLLLLFQCDINLLWLKLYQFNFVHQLSEYTLCRILTLAFRVFAGIVVFVILEILLEVYGLFWVDSLVWMLYPLQILLVLALETLHCPS